MTVEETLDESLLAEYQAQLARLHYDGFGAVTALVLSPRPDQHELVFSLRVLPETGPEGQYPGKQWWRGRLVPGRQISAVNAEVLDTLDIPYDVPGDNLIIRGLDLTQFDPGDTLRLGEALLRVTPTPHRPCSKLARRTTLTKMKALSGGRLRGLMLDALEPATLYIGDAVERLLLPPDGV